MKILTAILLLATASCHAQIITPENGVYYMGYVETGKLDTVTAKMLVSDCDTCNTRSAIGYAIRKQLSYIGDRMPPSKYDDRWEAVSYLDNRKRPFPASTTIWMAFIAAK